jgi:HAD superfamily hydrolase (TIGR01509 family)
VTSALPEPPPVRAVLFDLHSTLVDQGDAAQWLHRARSTIADTAVDQMPAADVDALLAFLDRIWENARELDPDSERDLDPQAHRRVFHALLEHGPDVGPRLADALYATLLDGWHAYVDAVPVLEALRHHGVATAVLSNVGVDIRHVLRREGIEPVVDAVVLSCDVGAVKPEAPIFLAALDLLGVTPDETLMVGDSGKDDSGAAHLGIRTLLLPRTSGPAHGLSAVLRLVGVPTTAATHVPR